MLDYDGVARHLFPYDRCLLPNGEASAAVRKARLGADGWLTRRRFTILLFLLLDFWRRCGA